MSCGKNWWVMVTYVNIRDPSCYSIYGNSSGLVSRELTTVYGVFMDVSFVKSCDVHLLWCTSVTRCYVSKYNRVAGAIGAGGYSVRSLEALSGLSNCWLLPNVVFTSLYIGTVDSTFYNGLVMFIFNRTYRYWLDWNLSNSDRKVMYMIPYKVSIY